MRKTIGGTTFGDIGGKSRLPTKSSTSSNESSETEMKDGKWGELPTETYERIEFLKEAFLDDEIGMSTFETCLTAAIDGGPPYYVEWFKKFEAQKSFYPKDYIEGRVWVYNGDEYMLDEENEHLVRVVDTGDFERRAVMVYQSPSLRD